MPLHFDNRYARLPAHLYEPALPTPVAAPAWLAVNAPLGALLGLDQAELHSSELLQMLAGNRLPPGAEPIALTYAGHQFGGFVPRLGDGRAILLGEVVGTDGVHRDLQLKGCGPTPFSRRGDGRAALGPVLREFIVSEAMHALGVPTTQSLAAVLTGEPVYRETTLPGAVLTRVATSHLRVGTFEYFAARRDHQAVATLVQHALTLHYPGHLASPQPALALFDAVTEAQIQLVAKWMALGFVHGVMNTDNCAISGETIDYGPCAFLDAYDPNRTFSSIDQHGRYAFAQQPRIAQWNLARLAEALLPLIGGGEESSVKLLEQRLDAFPARFEEVYGAALGAKLGLDTPRPGDLGLAQDLLQLMADARIDYTLAFRRLTDVAAKTVNDKLSSAAEHGLAALFPADDRISTWIAAWRQRTASEALDHQTRAAMMQRANPAFIPRNHRVEAVIAAATSGDLEPLRRLRQVLATPYDDQPEHADLATPPGDEQWRYRTFCGT